MLLSRQPHKAELRGRGELVAWRNECGLPCAWPCGCKGGGEGRQQKCCSSSINDGARACRHEHRGHNSGTWCCIGSIRQQRLRNEEHSICFGSVQIREKLHRPQVISTYVAIRPVILLHHHQLARQHLTCRAVRSVSSRSATAARPVMQVRPLAASRTTSCTAPACHNPFKLRCVASILISHAILNARIFKVMPIIPKALRTPQQEHIRWSSDGEERSTRRYLLQ